MKCVSLSEVPAGKEGRIKEVKGTGLFFTRLRSLGVLPETMVKVMRRAPLGGPLHIRLDDRQDLALPRREAAYILMTLNA